MDQQPAEPEPTQPSARQRIEQILTEANAPLCATPRASAPATSLKSWLNSLLPAASLDPPMGITSTAEPGAQPWGTKRNAALMARRPPSLGRAERSSPEARRGAPLLRRAGLTANARAER